MHTASSTSYDDIIITVIRPALLSFFRKNIFVVCSVAYNSRRMQCASIRYNIIMYLNTYTNSTNASYHFIYKTSKLKVDRSNDESVQNIIIYNAYIHTTQTLYKYFVPRILSRLKRFNAR